MNLSRVKKYLPLVLMGITIVIIIVLNTFLSKDIAIKIDLTIIAICLVARFILKLLSKTNQTIIPIKDKTSTIIKLYEMINLENTNTIVAINTKDETVLKNAKSIFPGSQEQKQKDLYSIMLPNATIKALKKFLKDNDPERIIIHNFTKSKKDEQIRTLSICIDNQLIMQYSKDLLSNEEIKKMKEILSEK